MIMVTIFTVGFFAGCEKSADDEGREIPQADISLPLPPYTEVVQSLASARQDFNTVYHSCDSAAAKRKVLAEAHQHLYSTIHKKMLPHWLGTDWDYNGTTRIPQQGEIACGFFVTTVLQDAGFRLQRVYLAQQASEIMIKSLTRPEHIKRYNDVTIDEFVQSIRRWGDGLYIVGLDSHTGFIVCDNNRVSFIHSSGIKPRMVINEVAADSPILSVSRYRVAGKISADNGLLMKWLESKPILSSAR